MDKKIKVISIIAFVIILFSNISVATSDTTKESDLKDTISIESKIKIIMKMLHIPSITACVIKENNVTYQKAFGLSHVYLRKSADVNTIYDIGSISKVFTSTAILQLVEKSNIRLDENISHFFPYDIKNPNYPNVNITIRMLLAHQSSLNFDMELVYRLNCFTDNATEWIKQRILPDGENYKPDRWCSYKPGENLTYSNTGYIIVGAIVEKITGKSFAVYCKENIFSPLGMDNTSYDVNDLDKSRIARPYFHILGPLYLPINHYDLRCGTPFAGVRTTVVDLSKYLMIHLNNGSYSNVTILNDSTINEMHRVQYPNNTMPFYEFKLAHGLGWLYLTIDNETYGGYNGGAFGYSCNMMVRESDNSAIISLSNSHFKRFAIKKLTFLKFSIFNEIANLLFEKVS